MLTESELKELRECMERELAQIVDTLEGTDRASAPVELDQSSVGRLSRMDAMQQQAIAAGSRERLLVQRRRLDAALDRVVAGRYGRCCQCGAEVALERLRADPATPFCAPCQEDIDEQRAG